MKLFNLFKKNKNKKKETLMISVGEASFSSLVKKEKISDYTNNEFLNHFEEIGWEFSFYGAEGPYFDKGAYRLQVIHQSPTMLSVYNQNWMIEGKQNLLIFTKNDFHTIFFGYAETKEEVQQAFKLLKL